MNAIHRAQQAFIRHQLERRRRYQRFGDANGRRRAMEAADAERRAADEATVADMVANVDADELARWMGLDEC